MAAGPYGSARVGTTSSERARSAHHGPGSPDPASPTLRHTPDSLASAPLMRWRPELDKLRPSSVTPRRHAHSCWQATITSIGGLRVSMRPSHQPAGTPFRLAQRTTALEAMTRRRRSVRSPIREVRSRRSGRALHRRQTDLGRKISTRAECRRRGCQCLNRGGDQAAGYDPT